MISKWEYFIKDALPRGDLEQPGSRMFGQIIYTDGDEYEDFLDPMQVSAEALWDSI